MAIVVAVNTTGFYALELKDSLSCKRRIALIREPLRCLGPESSPRRIPMLTRLAIVTAPALFVLLWSTGFIGARYGMPYIEPLTFLAVRMGFAVVIMGAIALLTGARRPNANEIGHSVVAGSLVHGLTLGGVFTAISQGVPAGISALILGLQPIVTSTLANRFMGEKVTRPQLIGLSLGAIKAELKWLTGELGPARELDVLVHRVVALMMTTQDLARHVINP